MEWLSFKTPKNKLPVDEQDRWFRKYGEFSLESDEAFDRHIERLTALVKRPDVKKLNGSRLKFIYQVEGLMYWRP